ncbi:hypothetical protein XELAEV_18009197mg [Xenopus laevis]|uniref:Uncharacterized protein n=1 Tax=Xenopus laevis TaxID=8355 RepID=A0A974I0S8_XENLA|nr:hypothetical protein XELAEV_18009197mg [Xenopus laevis]
MSESLDPSKWITAVCNVSYIFIAHKSRVIETLALTVVIMQLGLNVFNRSLLQQIGQYWQMNSFPVKFIYKLCLANRKAAPATLYAINMVIVYVNTQYLDM